MTTSIVLCAMPRSGSSYLTRLLRAGLRSADAPPTPRGDFPDFYLGQEQLDAMRPRGNFVWQTHLAPVNGIFRQLDMYVGRVVVHMRDPRQAALSWVHWAAKHEIRSYHQPDDLYFRSLPEQIDWTLQVYFPALCAWAANWLRGPVVGEKWPRILFTDFSELVTYETGLIHRILDFCRIPLEQFIPPDAPPIGEDFRLGRQKEWCGVFTPRQSMYCQEMLDAYGLGRQWLRYEGG